MHQIINFVFLVSYIYEIRTRVSFYSKWKVSKSDLGKVTPKGVKRGQNGVMGVVWALIITKFGGKEGFCKLLKYLSLHLQFFDFESPVWPPEEVKWGSKLKLFIQDTFFVTL